MHHELIAASLSVELPQNRWAQLARSPLNFTKRALGAFAWLDKICCTPRGLSVRSAEDNAGGSFERFDFTWCFEADGFFNQCRKLRASRVELELQLQLWLCWLAKTCARFNRLQSFDFRIVILYNTYLIIFCSYLYSRRLGPMRQFVILLWPTRGLDWFDHVNQHGTLHSRAYSIVHDGRVPLLQIATSVFHPFSHFQPSQPCCIQHLRDLRQYLLSFFQFMDIIGTLSMAFDISFLLGSKANEQQSQITTGKLGWHSFT